MPLWLSAALLAFVVGSLAEYWGHRMMHLWLKREKHIQHHRNAHSHGFLREFFGYARGSWPLVPTGFLYSVEVGIGFSTGALLYSAFAAYAHELQHAYPECCFWQSQPVHHLHHEGRMWNHNFGITSSVWDRVFGTYRPLHFQRPARVAFRNLLRIKWY
ncbi:MAG TPA: sterol desaturase family protein [Polyangiaceae bacterium]|nr:sterol desaturase family protein [Polyangiaceae bacterium]